MKIIKKLISIFIGLMSISSIIIFLTEKNPTLKIIFFIETIIFGLITYLLLKSKRKIKVRYCTNGSSWSKWSNRRSI